MYCFCSAIHPFNNISFYLERIQDIPVEILVVKNNKNMPLFRHVCYRPIINRAPIQRGAAKHMIRKNQMFTRRVYHDRAWMTSAKQSIRPCDKMYIYQETADGIAAS